MSILREKNNTKMAGVNTCLDSKAALLCSYYGITRRVLVITLGKREGERGK